MLLKRIIVLIIYKLVNLFQISTDLNGVFIFMHFWKYPVTYLPSNIFYISSRDNAFFFLHSLLVVIKFIV